MRTRGERADEQASRCLGRGRRVWRFRVQLLPVGPASRRGRDPGTGVRARTAIGCCGSRSAGRRLLSRLCQYAIAARLGARPIRCAARAPLLSRVRGAGVHRIRTGAQLRSVGCRATDDWLGRVGQLDGAVGGVRSPVRPAAATASELLDADDRVVGHGGIHPACASAVADGRLAWPVLDGGCSTGGRHGRHCRRRPGRSAVPGRSAPSRRVPRDPHPPRVRAITPTRLLYLRRIDCRAGVVGRPLADTGRRPDGERSGTRPVPHQLDDAVLVSRLGRRDPAPARRAVGARSG